MLWLYFFWAKKYQKKLFRKRIQRFCGGVPWLSGGATVNWDLGILLIWNTLGLSDYSNYLLLLFWYSQFTYGWLVLFLSQKKYQKKLFRKRIQRFWGGVPWLSSCATVNWDFGILLIGNTLGLSDSINYLIFYFFWYSQTTYGWLVLFLSRKSTQKGSSIKVTPLLQWDFRD